MPLVLWLTPGALAQGTTVAWASPEKVSPDAPGLSSSLSSSWEAAEPATPVAAAPVTLVPPPKRVRALPDPGSGSRFRPFHAAAFGLKASTLGAGAEMAVPIARKLNVRVGGSYLHWNATFSKDAIDYAPGVKFTAGQGTLDWFPRRGGFHVSAGALYFRNHIAATGTVVAGQGFVLGPTTYINSVDDPVSINARAIYGRQVAPLVLLGFGNLLPRGGRHLSLPVEFGGAYLQAPTLSTQMTGTACTSQGCFNAATDAGMQADLKSEMSVIRSDLHFFQVFPVVSVGLACRF